MVGLIVFGALGIATLYFYKKIAQHLYKISFFKKILTRVGTDGLAIVFGICLILTGFLYYYSGNGEREAMNLLNSPEILDVLKNTP